MPLVFTYCCKHCSISEMIPREQIRACFRMIANFFTLVTYNVGMTCGSDHKFCRALH